MTHSNRKATLLRFQHAVETGDVETTLEILDKADAQMERMILDYQYAWVDEHAPVTDVDITRAREMLYEHFPAIDDALLQMTKTKRVPLPVRNKARNLLPDFRRVKVPIPALLDDRSLREVLGDGMDRLFLRQFRKVVEMMRLEPTGSVRWAAAREQPKADGGDSADSTKSNREDLQP